MTELDTSSLSSAEKAKAVQQLAVATGVYVDKGNALRGLPTFTVEHASGEEVLKRLRGQSPSYVVDTTAEEITDAEVVDTSEAEAQEPNAVRRETSGHNAPRNPQARAKPAVPPSSPAGKKPL
jgi:hypothetical protein